MTTRGILSRWAVWTGTWRQARSSHVFSFRWLQVNEWDKEGGAYFEVTEEDGRKVAHRPRLRSQAGRKILREDVALFARAVSPFNRKRFVTICNGMYGRGTYGAVRALTDERFRDRNTEYIQAQFADSEAFCILTRVTVENTVTLTPDWTLPETRLFEWSRSTVMAQHRDGASPRIAPPADLAGR